MKNNNKTNILIIDQRMRTIEKQKLKELGYNLIEIESSESVYKEISSHVDIFICKIKDKIIIEPRIYEKIKKNLDHFNVEKWNEQVEKKYPHDIKYNVCTIGKKAIHNFEYTDSKIKKELENQEYELISTTQGYTNCSIAVIDENSAIVTDKGLYKILQKHNVDVLYLDYTPNIKLLNNNRYSNRNGFIGGAISRIENNIVIFGDLSKIDKNHIIRDFITKRKLNIIDFKGLDVIDYGGVIEYDNKIYKN